MKNLEIIKKYAFAIAAIAMAVGFSAFKMNESKSAKILAPVTIYFHGEATDPDQVSDESLWTDEPNGQSCNTGSNSACAMLVDENDLITSPNSNVRELDPSKITLGALQTPTNEYVPTKESGSSSFISQNRN